MKMMFRVIPLVFCFAFAAFAEEILDGFSFRTIDSRTVVYKAEDRAPMVVNVGAHW